jgi:Holliday junction resolvase
MANAKYVKGRTFEYKIATIFRRKGYYVVRAAGSHGPADLVAVKRKQRVIFIQCKKGTGGVDMEEHNKLFRSALEAGAIPVIASAEDRKPTVFKVITGIALKTGDAEKIVKGSAF